MWYSDRSNVVLCLFLHLPAVKSMRANMAVMTSFMKQSAGSYLLINLKYSLSITFVQLNWFMASLIPRLSLWVMLVKCGHRISLCTQSRLMFTTEWRRKRNLVIIEINVGPFLNVCYSKGQGFWIENYVFTYCLYTWKVCIFQVSLLEE